MPDSGKSILVADCDSWQGYYVASALAKLACPSPISIYAAVRCNPTANPYALDLSLHTNVHLRTYDPQSDTNELLAHDDIDTLVLIPTSLDPPAHTLALSMMRAAEMSSRCSRVIVWSTAVADARGLDVVKSIERLVLESTSIAEMLIGKVPWVSPIANKFAPVDAKDVAMVIAKLSTMDSLVDKWNGRLVTVVAKKRSGNDPFDNRVQIQMQLMLEFMSLLQQDKLQTLSTTDETMHLSSTLGKQPTRLVEFVDANVAAFRGDKNSAMAKSRSFERPTGPGGKVEGGGKVLTEEEAKLMYQEDNINTAVPTPLIPWQSPNHPLPTHLDGFLGRGAAKPRVSRPGSPPRYRLPRRRRRDPHQGAATAYNNSSDSRLYSSIGSNVLVAIAPPTAANPSILASVAGEAVQDKYVKLYKSLHPIPPGSVMTKEQPHAFAVANSLYFALRRTGVDQSVVLRGEQGSGKSHQAHLIMTHLARLASSSSKRDDKLASRLSALHTVLSAFGHAATPHSPSASQFGAYYELQFSDRGKLQGIKTITYALDRDLVTTQRLGQRNFHAFYALLAGAPAEMRQAFGLGTTPGQVFPYLNFGYPGPLPAAGAMDDASRFSQMSDALKTLGIGKRASHYVYKLMAAILHLGQVQFANDEFHAQDACVVKTLETLYFVADLLEVDPRVLQATLTSKAQLVGRDLVTQLLTADKAVKHRDNLAKVLYHVLFAWIVEQANAKMCAAEEDADGCSFIAVVDFPGTPASAAAEAAAGASARALANERIDAFVLHRLFEYGNEELRAEGMHVPTGAMYNLSTRATEAFTAAADADDAEALPGDFINLIRGGNGNSGSKAAAFHAMFSEQTLNMDAYHRNAATVLRAKTLMRRTPSMKRRPAVDAAAAGSSAGSHRGEATELVTQLAGLVSALEATQVRVVYCVAPNRAEKPSSALDSKCVRAQLLAMQVPALVQQYSTLLPLDQQAGMPRDVCLRIVQRFGLSAKEVHVGPSLVVTRDDVWVYLETMVRKAEAERKKQAKAVKAGGVDRRHSMGSQFTAGENESVYSDGDAMTEDGNATDFDGESVYAESVAFPGEHRDRSLEMMPLKGRPSDPLLGATAAAGGARHLSTTPTDGQDDDEEEKRPVSGSRKRWVALTWCLTWWIPTCCLARCGKMARPDVQMAWREKMAICILILFACALQLFFIIGFGRVICPRQNVLNLNELSFKRSASERLVGIYGAVYDLKDFETEAYHSPTLMDSYAGLDITAGFPRVPAHYCRYAAEFNPSTPPIDPAGGKPTNGSFIRIRHREFYDRDLVLAQRRIDYRLRLNLKSLIGWDPNVVRNLSTDRKGDNRLMFIVGERVYDLQPYINTVGASDGFIPSAVVEHLKQNRGMDLNYDRTFLDKFWLKDRSLRDCFNNLFVVGVVDYRKSRGLGDDGAPENFDKFVILQVPCYTEGEDSLRKCIDGLASMRYDDKRKLVRSSSTPGRFVPRCRWPRHGFGQRSPDPRIVLDILGVDPALDPEPLSFQSLGEGMKQHNMGKVYSGLYECMGHLVPYIVVVKVGKPSETAKPGNRGKRDSQMILMRWLNKVMSDAPMSPLELEITHQVKNVIGVNPSFYEYCLMVDADTVVYPDSLTRLVAAMMHDTKIMGVFGSVTCLPGCFSMYRIRTHNKSLPLLVSNEMIENYGVTNVDTLHKKTYRYLTTLMLKTFPNYKTKFTQNAKCQTTAPDTWNVLLSQRRRWINSTIHNLTELLGIQQLCGFCCFSMRFVVLIDLVGTLVQPAIMGYLIYLIYMVVISLQAVGWMFIYILAIPVFSFFIPVYSFWKNDDFSWGNTRIVIGESGSKKVLPTGEEAQKFDLSLIPHKPWSEYESELLNPGMDDGSTWGGDAAGVARRPTLLSQTSIGDLKRSNSSRTVGTDFSVTQLYGGPQQQQPPALPAAAALVGAGAGFPTDAELYAEVQRIVTSNSLMTLTKKQVRDELSALFNVDLSSRKDYINQCIADVLAQLQQHQ
ncbi:hypothetical protein BCR44DRAFT_1457115 [Catenaria anguillulae PL171]|uniref:chitin synthase n=1 Tax=Catenaria anguillulae PL171 TaxID=765915 RepID=A0A1Y2I3W3_9FUNG|nr:hypothetical protein BCR44DRAFT_1457115 [Catenaria anguillulae PL171]